MKVSVIVPVYNTEKYVAKTLESLVCQTLEDMEIIVVNDGSTDNSQYIIDEFVKKYPKLIHSYTKKNGGLGSARNFGLKYAKGEYIGFVDSDDWVDEKMYESMYEKAKKEKCDLVICDFICIYDGWKTGWRASGYRGENPYPIKEDFLLFCLDPATACNKLVKKDLFYITQFNGGWYEDIATTPILLSYANQIGYLTLPLYYYRQHNSSITHTVSDRKNLDVIVAWKIIMEHVKKDYIEEIIGAIYYSVVSFMNFRPEFADEFIQFANENKDLFLSNVYVKNRIAEGKIENIISKQLIPKKIHYFWFGNNEKSDLIKRCIESWKKYAPDYEIIEWNEKNCNVNECAYVREAYEAKKWAFVADYFRIKKVYEHGGIYLDTDVELLNSISELRLNKVFFAFETKSGINAAVFGAVKGFSLLKRWLDTYSTAHLKKKDNTLDTSNTIVVRLTKLLKEEYKINMNGKEQILKNSIKIYSPNVLTLDMHDGKCIAQHHYDASWWDAKAGVISYKYEVLKDFFQKEDSNRIWEENKDEEKIRLLQLRIEQLENSTCWKITKPLRSIVEFIRRLKRKKQIH